MISVFAFRVPKKYVYRVAVTVTGDSQTFCKIKGITVNYRASKLLKFEIIRYMILRCNKGDILFVVNVHTEKRSNVRKGGGTVSTLTVPKVKVYNISFSRGDG